jgi:circadian clock protein KaiC
MHAALARGERATYFLFDEGRSTLVLRSRLLGMDLQPYLDSGQCRIRQIDPAESSTGEFSSFVIEAVQDEGSSFVALDSLNAYLQAMPGQSYLLLHMHELLTYLNHRGVTTLLIVGEHGSVQELRSEIDISYLSDATIAFRFFEADGEVRSAVTALKSRINQNERTIREFRLSQGVGLQVGEPLADFEGVMSGTRSYAGGTELLTDADAKG